MIYQNGFCKLMERCLRFFKTVFIQSKFSFKATGGGGGGEESVLRVITQGHLKLTRF